MTKRSPLQHEPATPQPPGSAHVLPLDAREGGSAAHRPVQCKQLERLLLPIAVARNAHLNGCTGSAA